MSIDWWTLAFEAINVAILIWLLGHFFWRPVAAMIDKRQAAASAMLDGAKNKQDAADDALAKIEQTRAGFAKEREAVMADARKQVDAARAQMMDAASKEAADLKSAAEAAIAAQQAAAAKAWRDRSAELAVEIARRLTARLGDEVARTGFLELLVATIRELPQKDRDAAAADGAALEAVSASELPPDEQARVRDAVSAAFGAKPEITFRTDPSLIAGLELHGPHLSVANSWKADLEKIGAELAHEQ